MKVSPSGERGLIKKIVLFLGLFLVSALLVSGIAIRLSLGGYLKSEACREWLGKVASHLLGGAQAEFLPLQAEGLESIYSDGFAAKHADGERFINAEQIRADLSISFFSRSCVVPLLDISRLRVTLPASGGLPSAGDAGEAAEGTGERPFEQGRFRIEEVQVGDLGLFIPGSLDLSGVRVRATAQQGDAWLLALDNGVVKLPNGVQWSLKKGEGRIQGERLAITSSHLTAKGGGEANFKGDFGLLSGAGDAGNTWEVTLKGVPVHDYLPTDWRARLEGTLEAEFTGDTMGRLQGHVEVKEGVLTAVPALDLVAQATQTEIFRRLPLHTAAADVSKAADGGRDDWTLSNLVVESRGTVRVEGALSIREGQLAGTLQVGLAPSILKWVPGGREYVFTTERAGYCWTPVQITGPSTHPQEDLSTRLAEAAVKATVGGAVDAVKQGAEGVLDAVKPLVPVEQLKELKESLPKLF